MRSKSASLTAEATASLSRAIPTSAAAVKLACCTLPAHPAFKVAFWLTCSGSGKLFLLSISGFQAAACLRTFYYYHPLNKTLPGVVLGLTVWCLHRLNQRFAYIQCYTMYLPMSCNTLSSNCHKYVLVSYMVHAFVRICMRPIDNVQGTNLLHVACSGQVPFDMRPAKGAWYDAGNRSSLSEATLVPASDSGKLSSKTDLPYWVEALFLTGLHCRDQLAWTLNMQHLLDAHILHASSSSSGSRVNRQLIWLHCVNQRPESFSRSNRHVAGYHSIEK